MTQPIHICQPSDFVQKDTMWKSCRHCGMIKPLNDMTHPTEQSKSIYLDGYVIEGYREFPPVKFDSGVVETAYTFDNKFPCPTPHPFINYQDVTGLWEKKSIPGKITGGMLTGKERKVSESYFVAVPIQKVEGEKGKWIVTKEDLNNLIKIKSAVRALEKTDEFNIDFENIELQSTIERVINNLQNFDNYFKLIEEKPGSFFNAECKNCGWFGSSEYCNGGHPIADTGDHSDITCPICDSMID